MNKIFTFTAVLVLVFTSVTGFARNNVRTKTMKVISNPAGAAIWLDGRDTQLKTPDILEDVSFGGHEVILVLEGHSEYRGRVFVPENERAVVSVTLTPIQPYCAAPARSYYDETLAGEEVDNTVNGYEYVDLGLSVKWATCNVGAASPEEFGSYFAWGETVPKDVYSRKTLKYCIGLLGPDFSKYNQNPGHGALDTRVRLEPSDDVAQVNWGGTWRMPTAAEMDELRSMCTWTWTTRGYMDGYLVKGRNGNSIFLPAAGRREGSGLDDAGASGYYWTASLYTDYSDQAFSLCINAYNTCTYCTPRNYGLSVRPVTE